MRGIGHDILTVSELIWRKYMVKRIIMGGFLGAIIGAATFSVLFAALTNPKFIRWSVYLRSNSRFSGG